MSLVVSMVSTGLFLGTWAWNYRFEEDERISRIIRKVVRRVCDCLAVECLISLVFAIRLLA